MLRGFATCLYCKHLVRKNEKLVCQAFPNGIPISIVSGEYVHDRVLKDQVGTLVFEPSKSGG